MADPKTKRSRAARTRGADLDKPLNRKSSRISRTRGAEVIELVVRPKRAQRVRGSYLDDFPDERLEVITALCIGGATDYELATAMGITTMTLWRWANANPKLREALTLGKDAFDERVTRMLATKALGYTYESEKIAINADGMVTRTPVVERVAPDTTAMIFWLKNRQPELWRDVKNVAMEGGVDVNVNQPTDRQVAMALINMLREASNSAILEDGGAAPLIEHTPTATGETHEREHKPAETGDRPDGALGFRRPARIREQ